MSLHQYYKFLLHERPENFGRRTGNYILQGHKLMMEFVVMAFLREQTQKLRWMRKNQKKIRAEMYKTLLENVQQGEVHGVNHGRKVILPASHYGSVRWYQKKNLESLAIARKKGKPHLFITMTCNPNHPLMLKALPRGSSPTQRPDIVLRIFRQQVFQLTKILVEGMVPGWEPLKGIISVIEFQKRGLPHVHVLCILKRENIISAQEIDKYAIAEIPDRNENPGDWRRVVKFMLHRPCGSVNPEAHCCKKKHGRCEHNFPKKYTDFSTFSEDDGSPVYRRRSPTMGGGSSKVRMKLNRKWVTYEYTSKDVVPHNLWLLEKFDCHINVEICSSLKVIKYLLWYPFKGDTRVIGSMGTNEDEISYYEDMRTVGATEAFWRIYEFDLHTRFPTVVSLAIHLEDEQNIYFEDDTNLQQNLQNPAEYTQLTSFFLYNEQHHDGINNQVTYMDFPSRFAWKKDVRQWSLRQNQNPGMKQESIGRLPALTPAHGDVFYLRSLLCHDYCKGKRSFDDLKMYNGNIYSTFKEDCFKIGLLRGDLEWRRCLEEASLENTARRMRALFATIIV